MVNQEHLRILVSADVKQLNAGLNTASSNLKSFGNKLTGIGKNLSTKLSLPLAFAGGMAIKMASDFNESLNKVDVAFGRSSNIVRDFAKTTITQFGIAQSSALDMAALFGDMATSMGLSTKEAADMSTQLVGLAGDLASFKNINIGQATTALAGVFTGETESLKRLGIVMTIANLELFAMSKGIKKQIEDMTQAEKVTLRYQYIMEKTANAQGDFNRTQSGSANQIRIFQESLKELGVSFGKIILPSFTKLVVKANNIINSFKNLSPKLKEGILRFGALAAILPPLLIVLGSIATGIGAISAPVAIAIAAVSALVIFFDDIVEAGENLRNFLQSKLTVLLGKAAEKFELLGNEVNRYGTILREVLTKGFSADISSINQKFDEQAESIKNLNKVEVDVVETKKQDQKETKKLTNRTVELKKAINEVRVPIKSIADEFYEKQKATEKTAESLKRYREALGGAGYSIKENINITTKATNADLAHTLALKQKANQNQQMLLQSRLQAEGLDQIFTVLRNNLQTIAEIVGGVLVQSFEALLTGGDFFKTLIDGLKKLVVKLLAAAAAAFVLNSLLSVLGFTTVPDVGALFSAFAGFSPMPLIEYANGGIISGPTLGLMGEYSGVRANPEVVAPLDKLKGMIGNQGGGNVNVTGEFRLQGQDLVVALQRANKQRNRIL